MGKPVIGPSGASSEDDSVVDPAPTEPRGALVETAEENTSGRPDLAKVAQERAAGRNKRVNAQKEV